jgi:hypothetical protein
MYSPGDEKGIIELLRSAFPKWQQYKEPLVNWKWKYFEGPIPSEVYVAKDGEQVVGAIHRLVLAVKIGDSILRTTYGDDVAVHPDYRRLGVMTNMKSMADGKQIPNGIKFHYIAAENPIIKDNIPKMGLTPFKYEIAQLLKIRNQESFLKRKQRDNLVTRAGVSALTRWSEVKHFFSTKQDRKEDFSIIDVTKFDDGIDVFWEKVKGSYDYCIVKKADYLNWKHSRPSISEHRLRLAVRDEEVLGFSALSLSEDGNYREGSISDLLALTDRLDVADALVSDACEHFDHEGVAAIHFQATRGHPYDGLAARNGFIDASSQNNTYFYYTIVNNSLPADYLENLQPSRIQLNYF